MSKVNTGAGAARLAAEVWDGSEGGVGSGVGLLVWVYGCGGGGACEDWRFMTVSQRLLCPCGG